VPRQSRRSTCVSGPLPSRPPLFPADSRDFLGSTQACRNDTEDAKAHDAAREVVQDVSLRQACMNLGG
jgi:hypothetical protein